MSRRADIPKIADRRLSYANLRAWELCAATSIGCLALAVYAWSLAPTVAGEDSGELTAAAYVLGVPHPPGYPMWCLIAHAFTKLPIGSVAWRVNLMSAGFAAFTVGIVALITSRLTKNAWAGAAAGLALAFSREFWEQSVMAEVYTLNAFFMVFCLWLLLAWWESRRAGYLWALAVVYGLSLGNHNTMLLLGPLFAGFIIWQGDLRKKRWPTYAGCTVIALLFAGATYSYLPFRAATDPAVNWGNPDTWERFWAVVSREQYAFMYTENPRTGAQMARQIADVALQFGAQFTWWLAWMPPVGLVALIRMNRIWGVFVGVMSFALVIGYVWILDSEMDAESRWISTVFYIPAWILAAICIGPAIAWLAAAPWQVARSLVPLSALACGAIPLAFNYSWNDRSDYRFSYDYAANILEQLDPNAIYFPTSDHATFPVLYLQVVEGWRPDVTIANKYGYPEKELYAKMPEEMRNAIGEIPSSSQEMIIEDWIVSNSDRPVYFTRKRSMRGLRDKLLVAEGLVYRVASKSEDAESDNSIWDAYRWTSLEESDAGTEYTARLVLSDIYFARGRDTMVAGAKKGGLGLVRRSLAVAGETKEALNNAGSLAGENGLIRESAQFYSRALELDPNYILAKRNILRTLPQLGLWESTENIANQLLRQNPGDYEALRYLAQAQTEQGNIEEALETLRIMANMNPNDASVFRNMGLVYLNEKQDAVRARALFARSLQLNPDQPDIREFMEAAGQPQVPGGVNMPQLPDLPGGIAPRVPIPSVPGLPTAPRSPR